VVQRNRITIKKILSVSKSFPSYKHTLKKEPGNGTNCQRTGMRLKSAFTGSMEAVVPI
jgi:hypothetical protein